MNLIILPIVLLLLGSGCYYFAGPYVGGGIGGVVLIALVVCLLMGQV